MTEYDFDNLLCVGTDDFSCEEEEDIPVQEMDKMSQIMTILTDACKITPGNDLELRQLLGDESSGYHFVSAATDDDPTPALLIPLFQWRGELCGIRIDVGEGEEPVLLTGIPPMGMFADMDAADLLTLANDVNEEQVFFQAYYSFDNGEGDQLYLRSRAAENDDGTLSEIDFVQRLFDLIEKLKAFKRDARKRGLFPSDGVTDWIDLSEPQPKQQ